VRVRLAPGVPSLGALGSDSPRDWLGDGAGLATGDRLEVLERGAALTVARLPLPGTPDAHGVQRERPRGAGTGMLVWRAWRGGGAELLRARLTRPRSASLAARRWNLICHLAAHGVGVPELAAMGEGRAGESFLIERELAGYEPLERVLASEREPAERARAAHAVGYALAALFRAGAWLPRLDPRGVLVQREAETCAAHAVGELAAAGALARSLGGALRRLPGVAFPALDRARLFADLGQRRRERMLGLLVPCFEPDERDLVRRLAHAGELAPPA
jgi:hypothetical protein